MTKSKYVIISDYGIECPIVFCPIVDHSVVCYSRKVFSAGFCSRNEDGSVSVWGRSTSLNIGSRPEDVKIIEEYLEKDI